MTTTSSRSHRIGAPGDALDGIELTGHGARQKHVRAAKGGGIVEAVEAGSPAGRLGIQAGDRVLSINGHRIRDVVDYQYYAADAVISLELASSGESESHTVRLVKDSGQPLGISFTQPTFGPIRECNNHCPFCFIDQLPAEMRASLYIRDDDYRYSFLYGNFVTLTNLNERDWERLAEQRLSPLYVSVHATDPALRRLLLGNDRAPDIRAQLERLFALGIDVHTQVVLCPGLNDGDALDQTVRDLAGYHPRVRSIGVVPVGLTRTPAEILAGPGASCSRILPSAADLNLRQFEPHEAQRVIHQTRAWQRLFRPAFGSSVVYASDELYLLAGAHVPPAATYDGYPQYENGIGMVRDLLDDWRRTRRRIRAGHGSQHTRRSFSLVCGELIAPVLEPMIAEWARLRGVAAELVVVENRFFGPRVRVSGLLTARDILGVRSRLRGDVVVLPEVMLDKTGSRLLDNVGPAELEGRLGKPVRFAAQMSGLDLLLDDERLAA